MDENKLLYYDVYGRVNRIYASHNRSYGFEQPYEHFHAKYELNFVVSSIPTRVKTLGRIYNIDKPHIRLHKPFSFHIASVDEIYEYERYVIYFEAQNIEFASGIIDLHKLYSDDFTIAPLDGESLVAARSLAEALMRDVDINMQRFALAGLLALAARYKIVPSGTETDLAELNYISKVNEYIGRHYSERLTASRAVEALLCQRAEAFSRLQVGDERDFASLHSRSQSIQGGGADRAGQDSARGGD